MRADGPDRFEDPDEDEELPVGDDEASDDWSDRPGDGLGLDPLGDEGVDRAPICGACGVTALPAEPSNVLDTAFVCDNEGCQAYGEIVA